LIPRRTSLLARGEVAPPRGEEGAAICILKHRELLLLSLQVVCCWLSLAAAAVAAFRCCALLLPVEPFTAFVSQIVFRFV
jgi:hypothetical protein